MKAWFADTYFFIGLQCATDKAHERCLDVVRKLDRPIVTTDWILTELGDAFAAPRNRDSFREAYELVHWHPMITVIPFDQELFRAGVDLYLARPDKEWSLTDCISFIVMERFQLDEALTGDHHFEQAGFKAILST